jgi:hypothetical protein
MHEQSNEEISRTIVPQKITEELGLDDEAIANLVGFFDVLIQMDIEQRSKERSSDGPEKVAGKSSGVDKRGVQRSPFPSN